MKLTDAIRALQSGDTVRAGERVLCAVSGGADSVALLAIMSDAARQAGFDLLAAHVHHGIRAESDEELEYVTGLCERLGVRLFVTRADVPAISRETGEGIESAARRVRYEFFYRTAREEGCTAIALAHHSRDQAETVLMHALRGASVSGLCAMRERAGMLLRPLLHVDPEELRGYLSERGLDFREDATNSDTRYTRNFVRHVILPECEKVYPGSRAGLCRLAQSAALDEDFMNAFADDACAKGLHAYPGGAYIDAATLSALHPAIQARVAARAMRMLGRDAEYASIQRILAALDGEGASISGDVRVSRGARRIYLERPGGAPESRGIVMCVPIDTARLPSTISTGCGGFVTVEHAVQDPGGSFPLGDGRYCQTMDADALEGAVIRFKQPGDRIRPLGAGGSKKLKDYYIDHKVDRQVRDFLPLVAQGSRVLWAMGVGVAEDAAVSPGTKRALTLRWDGRALW